MLNRTLAPIIKDPIEFDLQLPPCEKWRLKNNIPVYAVNAGERDVIMVEWVFEAGNWFEQKNLIASTTNALLKNGTHDKSAFELSDYFEYYGAYVNRSCYNETATITLHCLTKHLPELLPVIAEMLTGSVFHQEELDTYRQNQKQKLQVSLLKCEYVASQLLDELLYGKNHPYGKQPHAKDYDNLNRDEIISFYNQYYINGNCKIFTAGKLPENLLELLNKEFGSLPLNVSQSNIEPQLKETATQKKYNIINDSNGVQAAIRLARPFPNRHHPDFQKVQILNNVLGGYFGSRLMSNIREDKGYTYGIYSYLQNHILESAWVISTEVGKEVAEAALEEIYKEMKLLREGFILPDELLLVKNYMMGLMLGNLDGPFQIIARWKNYILNGVDENYFNNAIHTIKNVTPLELDEMANKYLQPEAFFEVVVV
jgi:zinc protease